MSKLRKCGFCKRKFEKLAKCWVGKIWINESAKGHRKGEDFGQIGSLATVYLCDECKSRPHTKVYRQRWSVDLLKYSYPDSYAHPYNLLYIDPENPTSCWVEIYDSSMPTILEEDYFNSSNQAM